MLWWIVLVLQAGGAASASPTAAPIRVTPTCPAPTEGGDVVVCGRVDRDRFRLAPLPDRYQRSAAALPKAEVPLLGRLKGAAETEQADVGGFPSNRVMLRLKLPF